MTRPTTVHDDDGEASSSEGSRAESGDSQGSRTRRDLLRSGTAVALALASAGCLSNPWSPGATRRGPGTTDAGDAPGVATTVDDSGGDGTTAGDGTATSNGDDGTATEDGMGSTSDGDTGTETATETAAESTTTEVPAAEKEPDLVVEVAPDGFVFSPESFEISAGDTVHWQWKDAGHNVRVKSKPDGSDWTGTPGDATDTYGEGYLHAHTFEESGQYEYYCAPHRSLGLRGSFSVR